MIAFLLMLAAVIAGAELLSLRRGLDGVEYDVRPSKALAEPDEPLQLITVVTNRRRRFLPFIRLNENVPDAITVLTPFLPSSSIAVLRANCGCAVPQEQLTALRLTSCATSARNLNPFSTECISMTLPLPPNTFTEKILTPCAMPDTPSPSQSAAMMPATWVP